MNRKGFLLFSEERIVNVKFYNFQIWMDSHILVIRQLLNIFVPDIVPG